MVLNLATVLPGLVGNVAIPRQLTGAAATWVEEGSDVSEQTPTFDQVSLTPRTCGTFTNLSRKMLMQSTPAAEQLVREDLAAAIAQALDFAAIAEPVGGAGPAGLLNTAGIGAVVGGDNGATATWDHVVALETLVALANADAGRMAYLTTPGIRGLFKGIEKVLGSGAFVWEDTGARAMRMVA